MSAEAETERCLLTSRVDATLDAVKQDVEGRRLRPHRYRRRLHARLGLLGRVNGFMTKATLEMLRRRAYSAAQFKRLAAESKFQTCEILTERIGLEVRLDKRLVA